jgi:DNA gyrase/topoisomerase IV subunit B
VTVTYASFVAEFPEFNDVSLTAVVTARIATALRQTPDDVWGDLQDDGVKWLAADLISRSPNGRELRLVNGNSADGSIYSAERRRMEGIVASGFRVTGSDT